MVLDTAAGSARQAGLTETLKAGEVIAGAELANPQNTISVRTR